MAARPKNAAHFMATATKRRARTLARVCDRFCMPLCWPRAFNSHEPADLFSRAHHGHFVQRLLHVTLEEALGVCGGARRNTGRYAGVNRVFAERSANLAP